MHQKPSAPYLKGEARTAAAQQAAALYAQGATIRSVAQQMGRSYGGARALPVEAKVTFRARTGGARKAGA
jgi:hypothetical protein